MEKVKEKILNLAKEIVSEEENNKLTDEQFKNLSADEMRNEIRKQAYGNGRIEVINKVMQIFVQEGI